MIYKYTKIIGRICSQKCFIQSTLTINLVGVDPIQGQCDSCFQGIFWQNVGFKASSLWLRSVFWEKFLFQC